MNNCIKSNNNASGGAPEPPVEGAKNASSERLIQSISMIKDILLSNMQLREELLQLSQAHEFDRPRAAFT